MPDDTRLWSLNLAAFPFLALTCIQAFFAFDAMMFLFQELSVTDDCPL